MSSAGLGWSTLIVGGSTLWCRAITALKRPAAPAAALVCPIWDFTVPRAHHWVDVSLSAPSFASSKTRERPPNSALSPAPVPVPWASMSSTVSGVKPAFL